eukprot:scaffold1429_cov110-Cylindrotheca_fusiformis.AAC.7
MMRDNEFSVQMTRCLFSPTIRNKTKIFDLLYYYLKPELMRFHSRVCLDLLAASNTTVGKKHWCRSLSANKNAPRSNRWLWNYAYYYSSSSRFGKVILGSSPPSIPDPAIFPVVRKYSDY